MTTTVSSSSSAICQQAEAYVRKELAGNDAVSHMEEEAQVDGQCIILLTGRLCCMSVSHTTGSTSHECAQ